MITPQGDSIDALSAELTSHPGVAGPAGSPNSGLPMEPPRAEPRYPRVAPRSLERTPISTPNRVPVSPTYGRGFVACAYTAAMGPVRVFRAATQPSKASITALAKGTSACPLIAGTTDCPPISGAIR